MTDRLHDDRNMTETIAALEAENKRLKEFVRDICAHDLLSPDCGIGCLQEIVDEAIAIRKELEETHE